METRLGKIRIGSERIGSGVPNGIEQGGNGRLWPQYQNALSKGVSLQLSEDAKDLQKAAGKLGGAFRILQKAYLAGNRKRNQSGWECSGVRGEGPVNQTKTGNHRAHPENGGIPAKEPCLFAFGGCCETLSRKGFFYRKGKTIDTNSVQLIKAG